MMYILIEHPVGVMTEAVVLSMDPHRLRVVVAGCTDTLELTRSGLEWVTDSGQKAGVGFLDYGECEAAAVLPPEVAMGAGAFTPWAT